MRDPPSYPECGYVVGPLLRVGRGTGAKNDWLVVHDVLRGRPKTTSGVFTDVISEDSGSLL